MCNFNMDFRNSTKNKSKISLNPKSTIDPTVDLGIGEKYIPVLGIKSSHFDGDTLVKSGQSIAGIAIYSYECYGDESIDPLINADKIQGKIIVTDVFGKKSSCIFPIVKKELEYVKAFYKDIENLKSL